MLYPVIKCECGSRKVADQEENHLSKSYRINGVAIVEEEDAGELYLVINLDGIDKM